MVNLKDLNIGIVHNTYLKKGGEDQVAASEYELLKAHHYNVFYLKFTNPENTFKQFFTYAFSTFNILSLIKCYRWIKQNNIHLLHVHNWFFTASPSIFWAAKWCGVPVVLTMHNYRMICPSGTLIYNGKPYLKGLSSKFPWVSIKKGVYRDSPALTFILAFSIWFNKWLGTWNIAKKYIVLTGHSELVIKHSHLKSLANNLIIKPNFVAKNTEEPQPTSTDSFLFVGRLSAEKGIHVLLDAFTNSKHKLTIIGDGPLQDKVEKAAKECNNITYLGFQGKEVINQELKKCSALIFPSIWYETFGLIMIEAFASSKPVIASKCGSASIIVKDGYNGLHFRKSDAEDLLDKLDLWASFDDKVKQQYAINAYHSYVKHYTPEKNLALLTHIYKGLFV